MCGNAAGAQQVITSLNSAIASMNLDVNLDEVGCLGLCYAEPLIDIQLPGSSRLFFDNVIPDNVNDLLQSYVLDGKVPKSGVLGYLGVDPIAVGPAASEHGRRTGDRIGREDGRGALDVDPAVEEEPLDVRKVAGEGHLFQGVVPQAVDEDDQDPGIFDRSWVGHSLDEWAGVGSSDR